MNTNYEGKINLDRAVEIPHLLFGILGAFFMTMFGVLLLRNITLTIIMLIITVMVSVLNWYFDTKIYFSKVEIDNEIVVFKKIMESY